MHEQHASIRSIARQMGIGRRTVRRYLAAGSFPEMAQRRPRPSILDPFAPYLRQRWQGGCHNALQLFRELHDQGYAGSRSLLSHWAAQRRETLSEANQPDIMEPASTPLQRQRRQPENRRKLSPAQAAWLLVCKPEDLKAEQKAALEQMRQASSEIALAYDLAQAFARMVREHTADPLACWLEAVKNSRQSELRSFASGIQRDLAAVMAGLVIARGARGKWKARSTGSSL